MLGDLHAEPHDSYNLANKITTLILELNFICVIIVLLLRLYYYQCWARITTNS